MMMDLLNLPAYLMTRATRESGKGKEGQFSLETLDRFFFPTRTFVRCELRGEEESKAREE